MAEFPPNSDDGELWLPSDIFLNEMPSRLRTDHFSSMDDLSYHVAALSFLEPHLYCPKPPLKINPTLRVSPVNPLLPHYLTASGGSAACKRPCGCITGPIRTGYKPAYEFQLVKPTLTQVQSCLVARARVLQRPHHRLQNHVFPFHSSVFPIGGRVGETGGTGVFHPLVNTTTPVADSRTKDSMRNRQQIQLTEPRKAISNQDYYRPPEMGLPPDWTY